MCAYIYPADLLSSLLCNEFRQENNSTNWLELSCINLKGWNLYIYLDLIIRRLWVAFFMNLKPWTCKLWGWLLIGLEGSRVLLSPMILHSFRLTWSHRSTLEKIWHVFHLMIHTKAKDNPDSNCTLLVMKAQSREVCPVKCYSICAICDLLRHIKFKDAMATYCNSKLLATKLLSLKS